MRMVIIGAGGAAIETAKILLEKGHDVVVIEEDQERIDALSDQIECGFLLGDGSKPSTLEEASPENTDVLLCMTDSDQDNIISALVGRSLDFQRVMLKIADPDFKVVCEELKLENIFLPDSEFGRSLVAVIEAGQNVGRSAKLQGDLRFFSLYIEKEHEGPLSAIELPDDVRAIALTRNDDTVIFDPETKLKKGDHVLLLTPQETREELVDRFGDADSESINLLTASK